jgi:aminodeoxyfutalosine deaminase
LQVVVFRELLGLAADRLAPLLDDARDHLLSAGDKTTDWRAALSPHAPYTVSQPLLVAAVELARQHRIPLAMHVAESAQEVELLAGRSGPLRELLESLGAWQPEKLWGTCPRDYLALLAQAPRTLVIHGNYLPPDDWQFLAERRSSMSVIFCPRTHAYFDHSRYPLDPMLRAGVQLAIGTDSRASNPDLSLFEEMRFIAQRYPEIAPAEILRLGTSHGAHAMGYETEYGQLRAGTRLPLTLAELTATDGDAYEQLWRAAKVGRFHPV